MYKKIYQLVPQKEKDIIFIASISYLSITFLACYISKLVKTNTTVFYVFIYI